jgi:hypothetical protein
MNTATLSSTATTTAAPARGLTGYHSASLVVQALPVAAAKRWLGQIAADPADPVARPARQALHHLHRTCPDAQAPARITPQDRASPVGHDAVAAALARHALAHLARSAFRSPGPDFRACFAQGDASAVCIELVRAGLGDRALCTTILRAHAYAPSGVITALAAWEGAGAAGAVGTRGTRPMLARVHRPVEPLNHLDVLWQRLVSHRRDQTGPTPGQSPVSLSCHDSALPEVIRA